MPRIERGQFADFLRRYLAMTGESEVAGELAPEVSPVFVLESERLEWEFLKGAKPMAMLSSVSAGAAATSAVRIRNPANSGVVAILQKWDFTANAGAPTAVQLHMSLTGTDLATVTTPLPRDTRLGSSPAIAASALIGSQTNGGGAFGDVFWAIGLGTNVPWYWDHGFVLTPGWAVTLAGAAINTAITGAVSWLEKRLDDLERK